MGIFERYNQALIEKLFPSQDTSDLLTLHLNKISRVWVKNLAIVVEYINNSNTDQLGYDKDQLSYINLVRYLLKPGEIEGGGGRRAGNKNWSPKVYHIREVLKMKAKSKAKYICYYLHNTGEICGRCSEGYRSHFKAKMRQPCSACGRPTKIDKPTGINNGLCSYCNKSNYQI
ncbi:hypothetical protein RCL_jg5616.t1 [Rhizophagus clarus]|uniref:Uncharacterized protein n=1 Tax=Rhizophagus clarus TaxID=94130 RepID=A0A8H3M956_9GLOM|nr:hypothetical protein RCL_jg5616.t1 [Rhizophagus clarus]